MTQPRPIWRTLFWIILILFLVKIALLLNGAVFMMSMSMWFVWLSLVVGLLVLTQLYRLIFRAAITLRSFITYWVVWSVILVLIGILAKGVVWTGTWQWTKSASATASPDIVATTSDGIDLLACQSDPDKALEAIPAGVQAKITSTPYTLSPDGTTGLYDFESTEFAVSQISLAKINGEDKDVYTAEDLPEGDVFFRVSGDVGFAVGKDFALQVCSTDAKMLAREALAAKPEVRTAEDASNTSAITMYLWRNDRVWDAGEYRAYGYYTDGSTWHLIARSPVFTITK